jgi:hypothetical protein
VRAEFSASLAVSYSNCSDNIVLDIFSWLAENSVELLVVGRRTPNSELGAIAIFLEQDGVSFDAKLRAESSPKLLHCAV